MAGRTGVFPGRNIQGRRHRGPAAHGAAAASANLGGRQPQRRHLPLGRRQRLQAEDEAAVYLENYGNVSRGRSNVERAVKRDRAEFRQRLESGLLIAGTPQRCIEDIQTWRDRLGLTTVSGTFYFGGMPQELALK